VPQDIVRADHFEKVLPMETKHTLPCKAHAQHLALSSDNDDVFSKWANIIVIIGHKRDIV
jgi:hypothetical protein